MTDLAQKTALDCAYGERYLALRRAPSRVVFARLAIKRGWTREAFQAWARGKTWSATP